MPRSATRRQVLGLAAAGIAAGTAGVARAGDQAADELGGGGKPIPLDRDPVLHVIRRLTYGPNAELVDRVRGIGVGAFIEEQLKPDIIPDPEGQRIAASFPTLTMPAAGLRQMEELQPGRVRAELEGATLARAIWSSRQLYEQMVEFWSNHFSLWTQHKQVRFLKTVDDRDVTRLQAMGSFREMLVASAKSPAMLCYLDNWQSRAPHPNENYARELLELHTVGSKGGYTERDVYDAAKVFTGWTVDKQADNGTWTYLYNPEWHVTGPVRVMGWRHDNRTPEDGQAVGISLLHYLAMHPSTARRIATKLAVHFVADKAPHRLVAELTSAYLQNETAIVPVLRRLFLSKEFHGAHGLKLRRPFEYLAAGVRAVEWKLDPQGGPDSMFDLAFRAHAMGQAPFNWSTPDGYPDTAPFWLSSAGLLERWNTGQVLSTGVRGARAYPANAPVVPKTVAELVDGLATALLHQRLAEADRQTLFRHLKRAGSDTIDEGFSTQWTPELTALLLNSPYLQVR